MTPSITRLRRGARDLRRGALDVAMGIAVLGLLFFAVGPHLLPYRTVTMLTGSMRPVIAPGDVAVVVQRPASSVHVGQILTFQAPTSEHQVVTHRVVAVEHRDGAVLLRTKGDANSGADPWVAKVNERTVWEVRGVVPLAGHVIRALRTPWVHLLLFYVAPVGLVAWLLAGVWRPHRRPATT